MSALPPKTDIAERHDDIRFAPIPDITGRVAGDAVPGAAIAARYCFCGVPAQSD